MRITHKLGSGGIAGDQTDHKFPRLDFTHGVMGSNINTAWCSEIGSLRSLDDAPELHASSDVREPISLHQAVYLHQTVALYCLG